MWAMRRVVPEITSGPRLRRQCPLPEQSQRRLARALRTLERRHRPCAWDLETERQLGRQRAQEPREIETAFAGQQPVAARLADGLLHVGGALAPRVAELRVV